MYTSPTKWLQGADEVIKLVLRGSGAFGMGSSYLIGTYKFHDL